MALTDDELAAVLATSTHLPPDLKPRQLDVLRTTYPGWEIWYGYDSAGRLWWVADLRRPLTAAMQAAGVLARVQCRDPIELASALAWQVSYVHRSQAGTPLSQPPGPPR